MSTASDPTQAATATEARLEELAREYSRLDAEREPITARMEAIKTEYRTLLAIGSSVKAGGRTITVSRNATFDPEAFRAAYPVMKYPHLYTSVPDTGAIRENVPPAVLRTFQKEGTPRVTIK